MKKFTGIFVPHITPFKRKGEIDFEAFEELIHFWKLDLVTLGSNGEAVYLSRDERKKVLELVVEKAKSKVIGVQERQEPWRRYL